MAEEEPNDGSRIAQWLPLVGAICAILGLLWGIIDYVQKISSEVAVMRVEIDKMIRVEQAIQESITRDHDELVSMRVEMHIRRERERDH